MELGMIGLGRMGGNIVRRLMRHGHSCAVYDTSAAAVQQLGTEGAHTSADLASLVKQLSRPRVGDVAGRRHHRGGGDRTG